MLLLTILSSVLVSRSVQAVARFNSLVYFSRKLGLYALFLVSDEISAQVEAGSHCVLQMRSIKSTY